MTLSRGRAVGVVEPSSLRAGALASASIIAFTLALAGVGHAQPAASTTPTGAATPASALPVAAPAAPGGDAASVGEVVVTGTRIGRAGFQSPTPVAVVGADRVEQLAATNIGDALFQVPGFRPSTTPQVNGTSLGTIGARIADLRGLGASRTLVLVDGRRFVPSTGNDTVDLNNIPTILLQRSEVVTGGASAQYGSDAVAGVINLIMDTKFTGVKTNFEYGVSKYGDAKDYLAAVALGGGWANGKGHTVFSAEYNDSRPVGDCYTRAWCATEQQSVSNATPGVNGFPAQVQASNVHTSTMTRGGIITSGVLKGTAFNPDGSPFNWDYGVLPGSLYQIGGSGKGQMAYLEANLIKVPVNRYDLYLHNDYDFSNNLHAFLEGNIGYTRGQNLVGYTRDTAAFTIQADNAYLPAVLKQRLLAAGQTNFKFGRDGYDLGAIHGKDVTKTYRMATGLKGELGGSWNFDAYYQFGRSEFVQTITNDRDNNKFSAALDAVVNPANGQIVCRSTLTSPGNGCVPIDVFGQFQYTQAAYAYTYGTAYQTRNIDQHVVAANIRGEPFNTWAGPVSFAAGGEYRHEAIDGVADAVSIAQGWNTGNGGPINGTIGVAEAYAETVVPLAKGTSWAKSLELNAAGRVTHYTTTGTVETWKVGAVYEPNDWLRFRATKSRDIRAPNLSELFSAPATSKTGGNIIDLATNTQGVYMTQSGGNPNLVPERADTFTGGVVFQPEWGFTRGFRVSVDYFNITVNDAITTVLPQTIVTQCFQGVQYYCPYIDRNPDKSIALVRIPYLNVGSVVTNGADIQAQYTLPLERIRNSLPGRLDFSFLGTYVKHLTTTQAGVTSELAGVTGCIVTAKLVCVPHWTLDGTMTYAVGPGSFSIRGHYIPKSIYDPTLVGPQDPGYSPFLTNSINDNRVGDALYIGLSAQYNLVNSSAGKVQIYGAVDNLTNKHPPSQPGRGNSTFFDPVGQYFKVGVRLQH